MEQVLGKHILQLVRISTNLTQEWLIGLLTKPGIHTNVLNITIQPC